MFKLIVDLEATCSKDGKDFPRDEMEIIEIGAVIIDENNEIRGTYKTFIQPIRHKILTDFCKELTTIKQSDVDSGLLFNFAMKDFKSWILQTCNKNEFEMWSWGAFDKNIIRKNCDYWGIDSSFFIKKHVNAKEKFAEFHNVKPCGVGKALHYKKIEFVGTPHRALDDAINITNLINTMS